MLYISLPTYNEYIYWLEVFNRKEQLKIIYLLLQIGAMHPSGMAKILENSRKQQIQFLTPLINFKIVEETDHKNPNVLFIYKGKKHFKLDDYHFKQATFYKLTSLAKLFFANSGIPYDQLLNTYTISEVENWKNQLNLTHKQIQQNICTENESIQEIKNQWWRQKNKFNSELSMDWLKKKLNIYEKRGIIFSKVLDTIFHIIKKEGGR